MRLRALLAALCCTSAVNANPAEMFGFGARGPALGNAMVASGDPLSAPVYNVSAGAMGKYVEIGAGYFYAKPMLDIKGKTILERQIDVPCAQRRQALCVPILRRQHHDLVALGDQRRDQLKAQQNLGILFALLVSL